MSDYLKPTPLDATPPETPTLAALLSEWQAVIQFANKVVFEHEAAQAEIRHLRAQVVRVREHANESIRWADERLGEALARIAEFESAAERVPEGGDR